MRITPPKKITIKITLAIVIVSYISLLYSPWLAAFGLGWAYWLLVYAVTHRGL